MTPDKLSDIQDGLRSRGICVVIPTFNNGGTIARVVTDVKAYCRDVIVVDDGCTDNTREELDSIGGITIVTQERNSGKGHALRAGFLKAMELGFAYAITLDGDGQHYAKDIPAFLEANREYPGSIIVGQRRMDGVERSGGTKFANSFSNFWFWVQTGRRVPDTQSGYRLYPLRRLRGLSLLTSRYEAELELMVLASWHGVRIVSIPVDVYYPPKEERVSHFRPGMDFARISVLNTVLCLLTIVYGLPSRIIRWVDMVARTAYSFLLFAFISLVVISPYVWLCAHVGRMTEKKRESMRRLLYHVARFLVLHHGIPGTRFSCERDTAADFSRPHVVICNHQSHFDIICQLIFTPKMIFLTNDWVWSNMFFGSLIRNAGYLRVSEGIEALMPRIEDYVSRGYSIAVYPEGTRSTDCRIAHFHKGAFHIAERTGVDIIPMMICGSGRVLRKGTYHMERGPILLKVAAPITRETLSGMGSALKQSLALRRRYAEEYARTMDEIDKNA